MVSLVKDRENLDTGKISRALLLVEEFRKIDPEMQMQAAAAFLLISQQPGITVREVGTRLGVASSSASRNVALLSKENRRGEPGPHLIDYDDDPLDRRIRRLYLTPKGKRFLDSILSYLG